MSMEPLLKWRLFTKHESHKLSQDKLLYAFEALCQANMRELEANPNYPLLYQSKIIYKQEPRGHEDWCDIPTVIEQGWGDCEDLAGWLVAELRVRWKIPARPFLKFRKKGSEFHYHALLILPHHYAWDWKTVPAPSGLALVQPNGLPTVVRYRKPIFQGPNGFVFEDPSARLGMYGGLVNREGAYESIISRGEDPMKHQASPQIAVGVPSVARSTI